MKPRYLLLASLASTLALASPADDYQSTREALVEQINLFRKAAGLSALRLSTTLTSVAQARAAHIASGGASPDNSAKEDSVRLFEAGYDSRRLFEIEARADGTVEDVAAAWRAANGPEARELEKPGYRDIGVGVSFETAVPLYIVLLGVSWEDFFQERTSALSNLEKMREEMLKRVNRERLAHKLAPLRRHPRLDEAAQAHADDMSKRRYYSHDTPEGKTAIERIQALGYRAKYAGENIAKGQYSVDEVMDGWMGSPIHREHLLSQLYNDVGFGLSFGKTPEGYEIFWVQDFARPKGRERL